MRNAALVLACLAAMAPCEGGGPAEKPAPDADVKTLMEAGVTPSAEGLKVCLKQFRPDLAQQERVAELVAQLGATSYQQREAASKALSRLPVLPREALEAATRSDDPEVKTRAQRLLAGGGEAGRRVLSAAMAVIARRKIKGLAADVLAAGPHCPENGRQRLVGAALSTTAGPGDVDLLRRTLRDERPWARVVAAMAIDRLLGAKADGDLVTLLKDSHEAVRFAAARALADRGRRECLETLAGLLASPDYDLRWRSAQVLRALSGKSHGFEAHAPAEQRKDAAAKWLAWTRGAGQKAALRFPVKTTGVVRLLNGRDLSGWKAVDAGRDVPAQQHWTVKDGVLVCKSSSRGYLYHTRPFTNYLLSVEWRWPKAGGDSGVWFLMAKPGGARPPCLEAQLLSDSAGDFWIIGGLRIQAGGRPGVGHVRKLAASSEKPIGGWNRMTIRVLAGAVTVTVNGVKQNQATECPRGAGHIALQSEGQMIEFRKVDVQPLGG